MEQPHYPYHQEDLEIPKHIGEAYSDFEKKVSYDNRMRAQYNPNEKFRLNHVETVSINFYPQSSPQDEE